MYTTNTYSSGYFPEEVVAFIAAFFIVILIFALVFGVMSIIANWKIFEKAGEKGWKAIIPGYNLYIFFKLFWNTNMFWACLVAAFAGGFISGGFENIAWLGSLLTLAAAVLEYVMYWYMCKSFGKTTGFFVGYLFLTPIFGLILGFDSSQYAGNVSPKKLG